MYLIAETVDVKIGKSHQGYENTNLTELQYDGIAVHDFEEGDIVDLTCGNNYRTGQIRMQYYSADGKVHSQYRFSIHIYIYI